LSAPAGNRPGTRDADNARRNFRSQVAAERFRTRAAGLLVFAALVSLAVTGAPLVSFRFSAEEGDRTATVDSVEQNGIDYVPFPDIVTALGGGYRVLPASLHVDFAGDRARIPFNDTRVEASLNVFSLRYPLLRESATALIAVADVTPFFKQAFRVDVEQVESARHGQMAAADVTVETLDEPQALGREATGSRGRTPPALLRAPSVIVIDAGHGGSDAGAEGGTNRLQEKQLTLAVARNLAHAVKAALRADVFLTRRDDVDVSLGDRALSANDNRGDLLISIHAGASFSPAAHGFEIFYASRSGSLSGGAPGETDSGPARLESRIEMQSREIALAVARSLDQAVSAVNRGVHDIPSRLLEEAEMPAILIEIGFLTSATEEALLETEAYRGRIAEAIAAGLRDYVESAGIAEVE